MDRPLVHGQRFGGSGESVGGGAIAWSQSRVEGDCGGGSKEASSG